MNAPCQIKDLAQARTTREALALESGLDLRTMADWDKLLLLADRSWTWRDAESLAELIAWVQQLAKQVIP